MASTTNIAIVVIAYNRPKSLSRLLASLEVADYLGDRVDLLISVDNSGDPSIAQLAKAFQWSHGKKTVIAHPQRLGLKAHVIKCGELTSVYEHLCVFEDDLFASPSFYSFAKAACSHFSGIDCLAGISLYSHLWNPYVNRPFLPLSGKYDVYLLQVASSWGQIWSRDSWRPFVQWMAGKRDEDLHSDLLPSAVSSWSTRSWLKFHNRYLVDSNKYFLYPTQSLSTNFSELGEHAVAASTIYQVPILADTKLDFAFPKNVEQLQTYDAFFENKNLPRALGITPSELDVSLYGNRPSRKRFLLSIQSLNYEVVRSFGLKLRPLDANIVFDIPGCGIYLYDTSKIARRPEVGIFKEVDTFLYEIRANARRLLLLSALRMYAQTAMRRLGLQ